MFPVVMVIAVACGDDGNDADSSSETDSSSSTTNGSVTTDRTTGVSATTSSSTTSSSTAETTSSGTTTSTTGESTGTTGDDGTGTEGTGTTGEEMPGLDPGAVYWGDFTTNNTYELAVLTYPPGTPTVPALQGITSLDNINDVALSPDGTRIVVAVDDNGTDRVLIYDADGTGAPTVVAEADDAFTTIDHLAWSPDANTIAFVADWNTDGENLVWIALADGSSATPDLVSQETGNSAQDAQNVVWVDDTTVAYRADLAVNNTDNIYTSDVSLNTPAPVALVPPGSVSDGAEPLAEPQVDATGRVYFMSSHTGPTYLFRADATGANLEQVPAAAALMHTSNTVQAQVSSFRLSPDRASIAISADSPDEDLFQIHVADDLSMATSTVQSNVQSSPTGGQVRGPTTVSAIVWSPDETLLGVMSDWQVSGSLDQDVSAFVIPATGAAGGQRILRVPNSTAQDVAEMCFANDSQRLFILGDVIDPNDAELFTTSDLTTADQAAASVLLQSVPTGGDVAGLDCIP